jgi:hypothetical protein
MLVSVVGMDNSSALLKLQERFCLSKIGGEIRVIDRKKPFDYFKKVDGDLLFKRYLEALDIAHNPKDVIKDFWISGKTLMYDTVAFSPLKTPKTTLNHWVGPVVQPSKQDCSQILDFLYEVICNGDQQSFDYLCSFISHCLIKPEEKPGICIVLIGGQGTGKGVFFQLMRSIWKHTTLLINDMDSITGRFNSSLEKHFIVCLDEALFVGDKKSLDRLKSMITEPTITIEQKYQPTRTIGSYHRFFAATNRDRFTHIERDDRRFLFLRSGDSHKQDTNYFAKLVGSFSDEKSISGFVDHLLTNTPALDIRKKPPTQEHVDQKIKSLEGFGRYWHEVLCTGNFTATELSFNTIPDDEKWADPFFKSTSSIINSYKEHDRNSSKHGSIQAKTIVKQTKQMCSTAVYAREVNEQKNKLRGFNFPSIEIARKDFADYLGSELSWDD